jgi:hypothetical protein
MIRFPSTRRWIRAVCALSILAITACTPLNDGSNNTLAGPCTETGNPTGLAGGAGLAGRAGITGKIVDAGGKPVQGAKVTLLERNGPDTSGIATAVARTSSCADGSFGFAKAAASTYALEAKDTASGDVAWLAEVAFAAKPTAVPILILKAPASISGSVTRGPNTLPSGIVRDEKILVRLLHTDKSFMTDTSGRFQLTGIGEGVYRASFTAFDGHYLTAFVDSVRVPAGGTTPIPRVQLTWSPFVAPPIPSGLAVRPDSGGLVRLHWHAALIDTPFHYQVERKDSLDPSGDDTLTTMDTALADTLKGAAVGHVLAYRVRLVNRLLNASDWSPLDTARAPADTSGPDTAGQAGKLSVTAMIRMGSVAFSGAQAILYRSPSHPGSQDSLPLPTVALDTLPSGPDGRVRFDGLSAGRYSLEAYDPASGQKAFRFDMRSVENPASASPARDTLDLKPTGAVWSTATRQKAWVTAYWKGNENIEMSLAGTPYTARTEYRSRTEDLDSGIHIENVPAGLYRAVFYAGPEGFFLPDTQTVAVAPGDTVRLPNKAMRYNPTAPPLKPHGLRIVSAAGGKVELGWASVAANLFFKGYVVVRADAGTGIMTLSDPVTDTAYTDDLTGIPSGTHLLYLVHVVTTDGKTGANGGDDMAQPVRYQVP